MFEHFIPLAGRETYRASPHKDRMDLLTQSLVSQRYRPAVIGQHLREWLRSCQCWNEIAQKAWSDPSWLDNQEGVI